MKKLFLLLAASAALCAACASSKKAQIVEEDPYNRPGSRQERENVYRGKVFAAYSGEGKFYATYALAELLEKYPDEEGYYSVRFNHGPMEGRSVKVRDIILRTAHPEDAPLEKGMVVIRNYWNPKSGEEIKFDRWNKAVVYDVSKQKDGVVVIEFPHDVNDFMATRETIYMENVRNILEPYLEDPRTFIP
jgi:hypothetical protein